MSVTLVSSRSLDDSALAQLFTGVYTGYWHPVELDERTLRRMASTYDFDLDASVVALSDGAPVGLAMLAARGPEGWVGGMGVLPSHRGAGFGERLMHALITAARERDVTRLRLEVLVQNAPAIAIYRRLGFADLGDVAVWRLDSPPRADAADAADHTEALVELAPAGVDAPWQRNPATISNMRALGSEVWAARAGDAVAVYANGASCSVLELRASSAATVAALLAAPFARGASSVVWGNGPVDGHAGESLAAAGATVIARQHHLALALD